MPSVLFDDRGPLGRNVPLAAAIRRALRRGGHATPVVTSGGIATFEQAEAILARGNADFIGAARQTLADPDWFLETRPGLGHLVRRCEFTKYCLLRGTRPAPRAVIRHHADLIADRLRTSLAST
jgi:2,4-dienoyl-CoA reductase-like NADH-dependent reductase (Old Yellow Enzyme family)